MAINGISAGLKINVVNSTNITVQAASNLIFAEVFDISVKLIDARGA